MPILSLPLFTFITMSQFVRFPFVHFCKIGSKPDLTFYNVGLQGDFGGPLVCQQDKKWVQYGIASFSVGGCGHRAIFEKVSLHTNAIVDSE